MYLCLHTDDPSESGLLNQVTGGSYAPQPIIFALDNFGNRLTNGGLEGTPGAGIVPGWTTVIVPSVFTPSIVAGGVAGTYQKFTATMVPVPNDKPIQFTQTVGGISDVVGQVVRLSVYARNPTGGGSTGFLLAEVYNSTNVLLGGLRSASFGGGNSTFAYRTLDWTVPAGASYAKVWFEARSSVGGNTNTVWDIDEMFFGLSDTNQRVSSNTQTFLNMPGVTITHFSIRENSPTGQPMLSAALSSARSVTAGDPVFFGAGQIVVRAD